MVSTGALIGPPEFPADELLEEWEDVPEGYPPGAPCTIVDDYTDEWDFATFIHSCICTTRLKVVLSSRPEFEFHRLWVVPSVDWDGQLPELWWMRIPPTVLGTNTHWDRVFAVDPHSDYSESLLRRAHTWGESPVWTGYRVSPRSWNEQRAFALLDGRSRTMIGHVFTQDFLEVLSEVELGVSFEARRIRWGGEDG